MGGKGFGKGFGKGKGKKTKGNGDSDDDSAVEWSGSEWSSEASLEDMIDDEEARQIAEEDEFHKQRKKKAQLRIEALEGGSSLLESSKEKSKSSSLAVGRMKNGQLNDRNSDEENHQNSDDILGFSSSDS